MGNKQIALSIVSEAKKAIAAPINEATLPEAIRPKSTPPANSYLAFLEYRLLVSCQLTFMALRKIPIMSDIKRLVVRLAVVAK